MHTCRPISIFSRIGSVDQPKTVHTNLFAKEMAICIKQLYSQKNGSRYPYLAYYSHTNLPLAIRISKITPFGHALPHKKKSFPRTTDGRMDSQKVFIFRKKPTIIIKTHQLKLTVTANVQLQ